ncbi:MAG: DUF721 domain-containing protein [Inquilinaceae bacterium]
MSRPRSLAAIAQPITRAAVGKRQAALGGLLAHWPTIIGGDLATRCRPEKVVLTGGKVAGGTLHLRVESGDAVEIQHDSVQILDRVNRFFGYGAIERLKIVQGPLDATPRRSVPRRLLNAHDKSAIDGALEGVDDAELRTRLAALGTALFARGDRS